MKTINYISTLPGSGKTHWAIRYLLSQGTKKGNLAKWIEKPNNNIYSGLTLNLINEVMSKLKGKAINYIRVDSTTLDKCVYPALRLVFDKISKGLVPDLEGCLGITIKDKDYIQHNVEGGNWTVLCTHDSIKHVQGVQGSWNLDLIMDEAPNLIDAVGHDKFNLSLAFFEDMLNFNVIKTKDIKKGKLVASLVTIKDGKMYAEYKNRIDDAETPCNSRKNILNILKAIHLPSHDVYSISRITDDVSDIKFISVVTINQTFKNFNKVIIMAAYFEDTDVYHLLKQKFKMKPFKPAVIADRENLIRAGYDRLYIIPMLNYSRYLSKHLLENGIISFKHLDNVIKERLDAGERLEYLSKSLGLGLSGFKPGDINPLDYRYEPIEYFLRMAEWMLKTDYLLCINRSTSKEFGTYTPDSNRTSLSDLIGKGVRPISSQEHGRNCFMAFNKLLFISALNYNPMLKSFYQLLLPDYDMIRGLLMMSLSQTITRTSIRNPDCDKPVHCLVSDVGTAEMLKSYFEGSKIKIPKIIKHFDINNLKYLSLDDEKVNKEAVAKYQANYYEENKDKIKKKKKENAAIKKAAKMKARTDKQLAKEAARQLKLANRLTTKQRNQLNYRVKKVKQGYLNSLTKPVYQISVIKSVKHIKVKPLTFECLDGFVNWLKHPVLKSKTDYPLFATFNTSDNSKKMSKITSYSALGIVLDIDDALEDLTSIFKALPFKVIYYETFSSSCKLFKYRLIIPLSHSVSSVELYQVLVHYFSVLLPVNTDENCHAAQPYYLASNPVVITDKPLFDVKRLITDQVAGAKKNDFNEAIYKVTGLLKEIKQGVDPLAKAIKPTNKVTKHINTGYYFDKINALISDYQGIPSGKGFRNREFYLLATKIGGMLSYIDQVALLTDYLEQADSDGSRASNGEISRALTSLGNYGII